MALRGSSEFAKLFEAAPSPSWRLVLSAFEGATEGEAKAIPSNSINVRNLWQDFRVMCKAAGVPRYAKPIHSLRKSCIRDWADRHPAHVVKDWAGHSNLNTTDT